MPKKQDAFTVTIMSTQHAQPIVATYFTRREAMRAANGIRATLAPQQGGRVTVHDSDGTELQSWVEHSSGGRFTRGGSFGPQITRHLMAD